MNARRFFPEGFSREDRGRANATLHYLDTDRITLVHFVTSIRFCDPCV